MRDESDDAVLREILEGPRRALVALPDLRRIERPGWFQIVTPSFRDGGFNGVECSSLGEAEADAIIDATLAQYRDLGLKFRWSVLPESTPKDLGARLERRGLTKSMARAMFARTSAADVSFDAETGPIHPDVAVEEVDESTVDTFTRLMAIGWNVEAGPLEKAHRIIFSEPHRKQRLFLARYRGHEAAVASYVICEPTPNSSSAPPSGSAYLLGGLVLPEFRGRGLYRALVSARLRDVRARGVLLVTTQARETTSAPILERMGFRTACRFANYCN